jgi:hypothetical protein
MLRTALMLAAANVFMTFAWYAHLKNLGDKPLWMAILASWGIAFFEYCIQVPANRWGFESLTLPQLKILQEIITLCVFAAFASGYMGVRLNWNHAAAALCMVGAAWFVSRG